MYRYYDELENANNFVTVLQNDFSKNNSNYRFTNIALNEEFFSKYEFIFSNLININFMFSSLIKYKSKEEKFVNFVGLYEYYDWRYHAESFYDDCIIKNFDNMKLDLNTLLTKLSVYGDFEKYLKFSFPEAFNFLNDFFLLLNELIKDLNIKMSLKLDITNLNKNSDFLWNDAWYITPNGYLYNNGVTHKEGNLSMPIMRSFNRLNSGLNINYVSYKSIIDDIINKGYISGSDWSRYTHLYRKLPTILTPEVEGAIKELEYIIEKGHHMNYEENMEFTNNLVLPDTQRSYQVKHVMLLLGFYSALECLNNSFCKLNFSQNKLQLISMLEELTKYDIPDILVRFSGFHKIESTLDKTITTSNLHFNYKFDEYLKRGWNLQVIPPIIYDRDKDIISSLDLNSYFLQDFFDKELSKYPDQVKILK